MERTVKIAGEAKDWYAWLIDPLPVTGFEADYYERRVCHVRRDPSPYYEELLSVTDLDTILGSHHVPYPDISLVDGDADLARGEYTNSAGRVLPLEVARLYDGGATIVFRQLHKRVPALARLCVALGQRFSSRFQTNIYLTPPDAQGFAPHWDTHDVFVLQVQGSKQWTIYDTPIRLPLKGQHFVRGRTPLGAVTDEFEVGPGSLVYLPRGVRHAARSTGEPSLHITLGLTAVTWTDFLLESVAAAALEHESLRRALPRGFAGDGLATDERTRLFRETLGVVQAQFDPEAVWRHFEDEVLAANLPLFTDLIGPRVQGEPLTARSRVRKRPDLVVEIVRDDDACLLRFAGREIRLPVAARPAAEFAMSTDAFRVRQLPDALDAAGKVTLVARLLREGVLQRI